MPRQLFDMGSAFSGLADAFVSAQNPGPPPGWVKPLHPSVIAQNEASVAAANALAEERRAQIEKTRIEQQLKQQELEKNSARDAALGRLGDAFATQLAVRATPDVQGSDPGVAGVPGGVASRGLSGGVLPYQQRDYYGAMGDALPFLTENVGDVVKYADITGNEMLLSGDPNLQRTGMIQQAPGNKETVGLMGAPGAPGDITAGPSVIGGEGGPFMGTSIDASSFNILTAANNALLEGRQLTPQEQATVALAWKQAFTPKIEMREVEGPDGRPTLMQVVVPATVPPSFAALQQALGVPVQAEVTGTGTPGAPGVAPGAPPSGAPPSVAGGGGGGNVTPLVTGAQKAPTEFQGKASGFLARIQQAKGYLPTPENGMPPMSLGGYTASQYQQGGGYTGPVAGYLVSDADKNQWAAGNLWLSAVLRMDTGAAETLEEANRYRMMFLPAPSDGPQQIALKAQARAAAEEAITRMLPEWMQQDAAENDPAAKAAAQQVVEGVAAQYGLNGLPAPAQGAPAGVAPDRPRKRWNPQTGMVE